MALAPFPPQQMNSWQSLVCIGVGYFDQLSGGGGWQSIAVELSNEGGSGSLASGSGGVSLEHVLQRTQW